MPTVIFIDHKGTEYKVKAEVGESAMKAATDASIPGILATCGGTMSCGTCHGYVDPAWADRLPPPSNDESDMLECVLNQQPNSRLTCQLMITKEQDGLIIRLPESQL